MPRAGCQSLGAGCTLAFALASGTPFIPRRPATTWVTIYWVFFWMHALSRRLRLIRVSEEHTCGWEPWILAFLLKWFHCLDEYEKEIVWKWKLLFICRETRFLRTCLPVAWELVSSLNNESHLTKTHIWNSINRSLNSIHSFSHFSPVKIDMCWVMVNLQTHRNIEC